MVLHLQFSMLQKKLFSGCSGLWGNKIPLHSQDFQDLDPYSHDIFAWESNQKNTIFCTRAPYIDCIWKQGYKQNGSPMNSWKKKNRIIVWNKLVTWGNRSTFINWEHKKAKYSWKKDWSKHSWKLKTIAWHSQVSQTPEHPGFIQPQATCLCTKVLPGGGGGISQREPCCPEKVGGGGG